MKKIRLFLLNSFLFLTLFNILISCSAGPTFPIDTDLRVNYVSEFGSNFNDELIVQMNYKLQAEDLPELTEDGYTFLGWYDKETKATVGKPITKHTILLAKWEKTIDTPSPTEIYNLSITVNKGKALLSWSNPTNKSFNGIILSMSPNEGALSKPITLGKEISSYIIDGLKNGECYTFKLVTVDINSNKSSGVTKTIIPMQSSDTTAPKDVTNIKAQNSNGNVILTWTDPTDTDLFGIEVKYNEKDSTLLGRSFTPLEEGSILIPTKTQKAQFANLNSGVEYKFTVKAIDLSGNKSTGVSIFSTPNNKVSDVKISPIDGPIDYKDKITLSCDTEGATIYYSINDGEVKRYDSTTNIFSDKDFIIKAYATADKMVKSNITTANYSIKKYEINFNQNTYGSTPSKITNLKKGDKLYFSMTPIENSGFEFINWTDENGNIINIGHEISKSLILNCNWKDITPNCISKLSCFSGDSSVTLKWTTPVDKDLTNIIISCDNNIPSISLNAANGVTPNTEMTHTINNLINGIEYTFSIKSVDKGNNESTIEHITVIPNNYNNITGLEDTPIVLEKFNGTAGEGWTYVAFGIWPQSYYKGDVNKLSPCSNINAWENCYTDGNGGYYINVTSTPFFAKNISNDPDVPKTMYKFSDGTIVEKGKSYFFKLEPIKWRVLTNNYNGKKLLFSEQVLGNCPFFSYAEGNTSRTIVGEVNPIEHSNYKYSEIRAFLNGTDFIDYSNATVTKYNNKGFLQKAFTPKAIEHIALTMVDNSPDSTTDAENRLKKVTKYACANTTDKIFLLSEREVSTKEYGFGTFDYFMGDTSKPLNLTRQLKSTDYAKAIGLWVTSSNDTCSWWLRTPFDTCNHDRYVRGDSYAENADCADRESNGFVPALTISF